MKVSGQWSVSRSATEEGQAWAVQRLRWTQKCGSLRVAWGPQVGTTRVLPFWRWGQAVVLSALT